MIALQGSSGNYRDVDHRVAALFALGFLAFAVLSPLEFHPAALPIPTIVLYCLGLFTTRHTPLRVWLTRDSRRTQQVQRAAESLFCRLGVYKTRNRTGVLIYSSRLEKKTVILADYGALIAFPDELKIDYQGRITEACQRLRTLEQELGGILRTLGVHLEHHLPPEEDPALRINELPDYAHFSRSTEDEHA